MKKIIYNITIIALTLLHLAFFSSCNKEEVTVTKDAKTGGLIEPTENLFYVMGVTTNLDVEINVPKGPGIASLKVYKKFVNVAGESSNEIELPEVSIGSNNKSADYSHKMQFTYNDLISGLTVGGVALPTDENLLNFGDKWVFTYHAKMEDGRVVINKATTSAAVSNFFAGEYAVVGFFTHPNPASSRDIKMDKALIPINANTCLTELGDLGGSGYDMYITVNADNSVTIKRGVTCPTDVFQPANKPSTYDPATGKLDLHYYYVGGSGNRVIDEVYTPL